jgi:hypothetical protein
LPPKDLVIFSKFFTFRGPICLSGLVTHPDNPPDLTSINKVSFLLEKIRSASSFPNRRRQPSSRYPRIRK